MCGIEAAMVVVVVLESARRRFAPDDGLSQEAPPVRRNHGRTLARQRLVVVDAVAAMGQPVLAPECGERRRRDARRP
jgi:hypothetical protein